MREMRGSCVTSEPWSRHALIKVCVQLKYFGRSGAVPVKP